MSTILGFNQTHMMNNLTNNKCVLDLSAINKIKAILPQYRQTVRWPGGTEANTYNCEMWGYSTQGQDAKWSRNQINAFDRFLQLSAQMGWSVVLVLNVYEEYMNPNLQSERTRQNMLMIQKTIDAGINIEYIELGNELNIWIDKKKIKNSDYNKDKANYDREISRYYNISIRYYNLIKEECPNLKIAAVYADDLNARDRAWQTVFRSGPWDGLVVHLYESSTDKSKWLSNVQKLVANANLYEKDLLITEWAWKLGPSPNSAAYKTNSTSSLINQYHAEGWNIMSVAGVKIACFHRITGVGNHPYNYVKF